MKKKKQITNDSEEGRQSKAIYIKTKARQMLSNTSRLIQTLRKTISSKVKEKDHQDYLMKKTKNLYSRLRAYNKRRQKASTML